MLPKVNVWESRSLCIGKELSVRMGREVVVQLGHAQRTMHSPAGKAGGCVPMLRMWKKKGIASLGKDSKI